MTSNLETIVIDHQPNLTNNSCEGDYGQLLKTTEADVCLSKKKVIHPHPLVRPRVKGLEYCYTCSDRAPKN